MARKCWRLIFFAGLKTLDLMIVRRHTFQFWSNMTWSLKRDLPVQANFEPFGSCFFVEVTSWMLMPAIGSTFCLHWRSLMHIQCSICRLHESSRFHVFLLYSSGCLWHPVGATCVFFSYRSNLEIHTITEPVFDIRYGIQLWCNSIKFWQLSPVCPITLLGKPLIPTDQHMNQWLISCLTEWWLSSGPAIQRSCHLRTTGK